VAITAQPWSSIASSADGARLVVAAYGGPILTSTNFGGHWASNSAPSEYWSGVASSADGAHLVATMSPGALFSTRAVVALDLAAIDTDAFLSWPWNSAGFLLEQSDGLPTTNWATVLATPVLNEWQNHVRLPASNHQAFYRLRLP
jgi:hypothetical protein